MQDLLANKRIAKNTLMLYCRTLVVILVTLYTSRVVLQVLGVVDYGIYNVVGGVVLMFSFISSTLSSASQRYIAFEIPRKDDQRLRETFSLIILSFGCVSLITFIGSEVIGVWFLNTHMNIPEERIIAANWVLQAAIFSFILNIFTAPYMAVIIAHEQMDVYAYVSIVDAFLKLMTAFLLKVILYDSLIVYAILTFISTLIVTTFYRYYCKGHYHESRFVYFVEKERLKEILSFAWWNMVGALANVLRGQGINILLNLFFNPAINAARAIAYQVNSAINNLSQALYSAIRPQITKSYSVGHIDRMHSLIFSSSRLSFCLMFIFVLPIYIHAERVLTYWLGSFPDYSVVFLRLVLINSLLEVFSMPLVSGLQATGEIKRLQQIVSGAYLLNLPASFILLELGHEPEITIYVNMIIVMFCMIPRLYLCHKHYQLDAYTFITGVLLRCLVIALIGFNVGAILLSYIDVEVSLLHFSASILLCIILAISLSLLFGINSRERNIVRILLFKTANNKNIC